MTLLMYALLPMHLVEHVIMISYACNLHVKLCIRWAMVHKMLDESSSNLQNTILALVSFFVSGIVYKNDCSLPIVQF